MSPHSESPCSPLRPALPRIPDRAVVDAYSFVHVLYPENSILLTVDTFQNHGILLQSFLLLLDFLVLEPEFCFRLANVIIKVFFDLFEKAKHEEDFVMYEKRGEDERSE